VNTRRDPDDSEEVIPIASAAFKLSVIGLALLAAPAALAATLSFDTLQDGEKVKNYYNGGFAGLGTGPGPMYGVTFSVESFRYAYASKPQAAIDPSPSPPNSLAWPGEDGMSFNVEDGFISAMSFSYRTRWSQQSAVILYEGLDRTGRILAQFDLPKTNNAIPGDNVSPAHWTPITLRFTGIARSAQFKGRWIVDNIVLLSDSKPAPGRATQRIPEPPTSALLVLGFLGLLALAAYGRRSRTSRHRAA
jgi:hypothetical protein